MTLVVVMVLALAGCGARAQSPPPSVAASVCPAPELSCKDAVEEAGAGAKLRHRDVTMAIGECEQQVWTVEARNCVAAVHASSDLVTCGRTFKLGDHGIFAETTSADELVEITTQFRDEMCSCTSPTCAQHVSDEMTKWGREQAHSKGDAPKMSDDQVKRFTQLGDDMVKCMQKTMGAGSP